MRGNRPSGASHKWGQALTFRTILSRPGLANQRPIVNQSSRLASDRCRSLSILFRGKTLTEPPRNDDADPVRDDAAYRKSLDFLYNRINYERLTSGTTRYPFRLARMRELLNRIGLSHFLCPTEISSRRRPWLIHIAGTKGKGSTATMVAACLSGAGFKTGLYTSPHLHHLEERFRVDGQICSPQQLVALVDRVRSVDKDLVDKDLADQDLVARPIGAASFFELTTALALLHFHTEQCDAVVLETGLGGRLDSTNVCQPDVTAITSIGLDHQNVLGDTLALIAAEKAGIIKQGIPIVSGVRANEPAAVIEKFAADRQSPLYKIDRDFRAQWRPDTRWGSRVTYEGLTSPLVGRVEAELLLDGEHQSRNAALAIAITQLLRSNCNLRVSDANIAASLGRVRCEGRIERYSLPENVQGIIDAAHNEDSIRALCECLRRRADHGPVAIVFGTSLDKSAQTMLELIADLRDDIDLTMTQLTRFHGNPRWRPPSELMSLIPSSMEPIASVNDDPIGACEAAIECVTPGGTIVVCGSFFLAAETRRWMSNRHQG